MKAIVAIALSVVLPGCASVGEIAESAPYATLTTTRDAATVAECIRDSWQSTKFRGTPYTAQLQRSGETFLVLSPNGPTPIELAKVNGGTVSLHFMGGIFEARKKNRLEALRLCL